MVYDGLALAAPILYALVACGRYIEPTLSASSLLVSGISFCALCGSGLWIATSALSSIWAQFSAACLYYVAAVFRVFDNGLSLIFSVVAAFFWVLSTWIDAFSTERQRWVQFSAAFVYFCVEMSRIIKTSTAAQRLACVFAFVGAILWLISVAIR
tara:strand:+ start:297 stop:761 length:465 start_codon:yes stop_codon:yes gene_type:complete